MSPGSRDSRRPRHPPSPRQRRTLRHRGLQKLDWRKLRTAEKSAKYKPCETAHQQPKHLLCILLQSTWGEQDTGSTSGSVYRLHVEIVNSSITHPGKDAEYVSTVEPSIREQSRPRHLLFHSNGHVKPYQGTGPVELHGPVHSVHCAAPTQTNWNIHQSVEELDRGTSNFSSMDCWNLSSMVTETSTLRKAKLPLGRRSTHLCGSSWCGRCRPSTNTYRHSDPTRAANECHGRPCRLPR